MKSKLKTILMIIAFLFIGGFILLFTYVPPLSEQHGVLDTDLFLGEGQQQPLIVAFGGGGGGNDWSRDYLKEKRDSLHKKGYAFLAIGYFNSNDAPKSLDRISLDAISDTIMKIAMHAQIDASKIALLGSSKGGELVLNLASRYDHFAAVIAMSTSHVSFPALTATSNTSSWMYKGEEVPYAPAPLKIIVPALKGDLFAAHSMMLEDKEAINRAEIKVENINGPVLLLSGKNDAQWPATAMSNKVIDRLKQNNFIHYHHHVILDGRHTAPLAHFDLIYEFLEQYFPAE